MEGWAEGAYQEFAVGLDYNLVALPPNLTYEQGSAVGVAFVAAVLALGVSLGLDFSTIAGGPDLFRLVRSIDSQKIPEDVRRETLNGIEESERLKPGDWLAVWGGSATSANMTIQLAKIAGLKVAVVVDHAKHGAWLSAHKNIRPDLLVDSHDPQRAVDIIRRATRGKVRAGLDTRGRETATHLLRSLLTEEEAELHLDSKTENPPTPPGTPGKSTSRAHLVGMTGLPKCPSSPSYAFHAVPIKLFHEVPEIGAPIASWLGRILEKGILSPPDILGVEQGLKSVNAALDRMRNGEISGGKLVVKV
ncbi:NADPH:quinone reductase or related Zn-dependent oxidoreductase [Geosmithia morbida]|uniref:NADPH:quinone reductase or related Zn-dependent oxidoreductase n=1 Tax=Geosmithia morbida TaxID=1094350 RepID=A0A9P5CYC4_9HYPO|nr:NADPH:quinone reductase or related Zn-dependent oxidoreductase [Geosmithia morbida]KAF4119237.1 NADPH:quinone reductase or related Zn-dependent oxidoreductase [Geosmithia morbida]